MAEAFPYLILDARYERVRESGVIVSQAVLIAIGIDGDGRRQSLPRRRPGLMTTVCRSCAGSEPVLGPAKPDPGDRRDLAEVRRDIAQWLSKWQSKYQRLCDWVEENTEETLTHFRLPLPHHKHPGFRRGRL